MSASAALSPPPVRVELVRCGGWGKTITSQVSPSSWLELTAVAEVNGDVLVVEVSDHSAELATGIPQLQDQPSKRYSGTLKVLTLRAGPAFC